MTTPVSETIAEGRARLRTQVAGMQCELCAGIIERRLQEQPGVAEVSVSLPEQRVLVEYDPGRVSAEQLCTAVGEIGFTAGDSPAPQHAASSDEDTSAIVSEGRRLLILGALSVVTVPLMLLELLDQSAAGSAGCSGLSRWPHWW
jgi:copper chaperone CopZ